jgi:hypothetical protein
MKCIVTHSILLCALLLGLAAASSAQAPTGTPGNPTLFETQYQINEIAAFFPVDLDIARRWVPPTFNLAVDAQGKATGALLFMDCPNYFFLKTPNAPPLQEGENLAPIGIVHLWLILQSAPQIVPVPGAQATGPTVYAYDVATLLTNPQAVSVFRNAGRNAILISALNFLDEGQSQSGRSFSLTGERSLSKLTQPHSFRPLCGLGRT